MLGTQPLIIEDYIQRQVSFNIDPKFITIHEVHSNNSSAIIEKIWLENMNNEKLLSYHYLVDNKEAYALVRESELSWHSANKDANFLSLSIAICVPVDNDSWRNAVGLVSKLLYERNWNSDSVVPHKKWTSDNCPKTILQKWDKFISDINDTLEALSFEDIRR